MKNLFFVVLFLNTLSVSAQHFAWEFRFYMLQDYFQQNGIKHLQVGSNKDSATAATTPALIAAFDEHGRLVEFSSKWSENYWLRLNYTYHEGSRIYSGKQSCRVDTSGIILSCDQWIINSGITVDQHREIQRQEGSDTSRINEIVFDAQGNMVTRTSATTDGLLHRHEFIYLQGQLQKTEIFDGLPRKYKPDTMHHSWTLTVDHTENKPTVIRYVAPDSPGQSIQSIHIRYIDENTLLVSDSLFYREVSHPRGQKEISYRATVSLTNVTIDANGLISCLYTSDETMIRLFDRYTVFRYEFYPGTTRSAQRPGDFLVSYLVDLNGPRTHY